MILPDGGILQGSMTVCNTEETTSTDEIIRIYNSDLDLNALSVKEADAVLTSKEFVEKTGNQAIIPYGSTIPTATKKLNAGAKYVSSKFSGSGWRLSELKFKPASGTGYYLSWTSIGDSAYACTESQAYQSITTTSQVGSILSQGTPRYVYSYDWTMYYTYNPAYGSYYIVDNS